MGTNELTIVVALAAGLLSFLSPCVLPLVPAYVGQISAVAVAVRGASPGSAAGTVGPTGADDGPASPARGRAFRHAVAYVLGFGSVFTVLGLTATFAAGPLVDWLPGLRVAGGLLLVLLGLNLAGVITIARFERVWRPLEPGARSALGARSGLGAGSTLGAGSGDAALSGAGGGRLDRVAGRLVGSRHGWLASFGLGAVFAVGWTPCIGTILGGILGLAATSGTAAQGALLLVAYNLGLGIPFLIVGALYDRSSALLRPLVRHGRTVAIVGGGLVVAIGVAMIFDLLALLPRYFTFLSGI
ncbi:MAG: cytochrome c assembly protein ccda [Chloroflexota bacterium]